MSRTAANLFRAPRSLPLIAPSILSADFARMGDECRAVIEAGADLLHLDVMDGHFVPNLTMGPDLCRCMHKAMPGTFLDVHLMVTDPAMFVKPFAEAGASNFTFHIEVVPDPRSLAENVRAAGMTCGLAINPPTDVKSILPFVEHVDLILVMSVNPGFSGQSFIASVLERARAIKPRLRPDQRLEFDGGVNARTARDCVESGGDVLVAASAIFHAKNYADAIAALRGAAQPARVHHPA